jgi:plastocyanin
VLAAAAIAACVSGCSSERASAPRPTEDVPPGTAPPATGDSTVTGRAPRAKGGLPAVVILEPREPREFLPQTAVPVMDQVSQTFTPAVLFTRTGQMAEFRNSDDVLHNVRVRNDETKEPAFNVAIPTGASYTHTFPKDGFYDVGCDIHPGMSAVVVSTATPFTALASVDGAFSIANVPPGAYTLTVYADVRKIERQVNVTPGTTEIDAIDE